LDSNKRGEFGEPVHASLAADLVEQRAIRTSVQRSAASRQHHRHRDQRKRVRQAVAQLQVGVVGAEVPGREVDCRDQLGGAEVVVAPGLVVRQLRDQLHALQRLTLTRPAETKTLPCAPFFLPLPAF
jgi:hypothetical protein